MTSSKIQIILNVRNTNTQNGLEHLKIEFCNLFVI